MASKNYQQRLLFVLSLMQYNKIVPKVDVKRSHPLRPDGQAFSPLPHPGE